MKNQKGFTPIELMIVVAIIGILAAIAIPNYLEYREKAVKSAAKQQLSTMYTAIELYAVDNSSYPAAKTKKPEGVDSWVSKDSNFTYSYSTGANNTYSIIAPGPKYKYTLEGG